MVSSAVVSPTSSQALVALLLLRIGWSLNVPSQRMDGSVCLLESQTVSPAWGALEGLHPLSLCYMSDLKRETASLESPPKTLENGVRNGFLAVLQRAVRGERSPRSYNPDLATSMMHPAQPRNRSPPNLPPPPTPVPDFPQGQGWWRGH